MIRGLSAVCKGICQPSFQFTMKIFLCLLIPVAILAAETPPADWETCKINIPKGAIANFNEFNFFTDLPNHECENTLFYRSNPDTFYMKKDGTVWWEGYGAYVQMTDGYEKYLPETGLYFTYKAGVFTLRASEQNLDKMAYGPCLYIVVKNFECVVDF